MAKKKKFQKQREPTKHQLSRWKQRKKRQRIILGVGIFIIAAVLVILVAGWYTSQYQPLHQIAIKINDTEFNMKYYIDVLKLSGSGKPPEYLQYFADTIAKDIEQNELIRQGALKLGFSVSDNVVNQELKNADLPVNAVHRDLFRSRMLVKKLRDEYFEWRVPVSAEQRQIMAMLLESESQAVKVRARLENEDFTELAKELSVERLTKTNKGDLGWHPKGILIELLGTSIPAEYAFDSEVGRLSQPLYDEEIAKEVGYWLIKVLERDEDNKEANVQAMLLGSEEEAQKVRAELEAGGDFATLAKELSQLDGAKEDGGDLGFVTRDTMTPVSSKFIFNAKVEPETLSEPLRDETVATKGGYWLVKVLDKDAHRQIQDSDRELLKAKALEEWVSSLWDDPENRVDDSYLDGEKKAWAIEQVLKR